MRKERIIEHLTFSENRESLLEFMNGFNIKDFSIKINNVSDYINCKEVLVKLGLPEDTHWRDRMLNRLALKDFDYTGVSVNPDGFTLVTSNKPTYENIREFIKSEDYYKLTQRGFINIED